MNLKEMTNTDLKVSIIMPVYRASRTIEQAVISIVSQSYKNWELIIINDCCPDNSCRLIENQIISNSQITRIDNVTNQGVAVSRNKGIAEARSNVIAFLDSDDYWHTDKLSLQMKKIEEGYDVVCSNYYRVSSNNKSVPVTYKEEFDYSDMLKSNRIGNLTGIYRCDHIAKVYQKDVGHEDYLMWLEVVKLAGKGYCIQQALAYYRVSDGSLSSNKIRAASWQWKIYRKQLNYGLKLSVWFFLNYLFNALKKKT